MKRGLSTLTIFLFLFVVFSPAFAQNTSSLDQVNSTKQQLITLLTKLLSDLESQLQNLLATPPIVSKPVPVQTVNQTEQSNIMGGTLSAEKVFIAFKTTDLFISSISSFVVAPGNYLTIK